MGGGGGGGRGGGGTYTSKLSKRLIQLDFLCLDII